MARKIPIPVDIILDSPLTSNPDAMQVFMHLLARANYKDGNRFKRGECPIGRVELGKATGQHPSKIDRVLQKLVGMCLIQVRSKSNRNSDRDGRVVTIVQYDRYDGFDEPTEQEIEQDSNSNRTGLEQQSNTLTALQPSNHTALQPKERSARFVPPSVEEVEQYDNENNLGLDCRRFVDFYESKGWKVGRTKMVDWHACARNAAKEWCHKNGQTRQKGLPGLERELTWDERHALNVATYGEGPKS